MEKSVRQSRTGEEMMKGIVNKEFSEVYVTYDPRGTSDDREKFTAFVRVNENLYAGLIINRYYKAPGDYGDGANSDHFRLTEGHFYAFNGEVMSPLGIALIVLGESESAVWKNGSLPTGGFHGNELLTQVNFFINGVDIGNISTLQAFELRPCKSFKYMQVSNIYQALEGVTIIFKRIKETVCSKGMFITESLYTPPADIDFSLYGSLVCIAPACSQFAQNDMGEIRTMSHASGNGESHYLEVYGGERMRYWSTVNGISIDVSGRILRHRKRVSGNNYEDAADSLNASARVTTKDNQRYGKYYRVNTNVNLKADDFIKCRTEVHVSESETPMEIEMTSPKEEQVFPAPMAVPLQVTLTGGSARVDYVRFLDGTGAKIIDLSEPEADGIYKHDWPCAAGVYQVRAFAILIDGRRLDTDLVSFRVLGI